MIAGSSGGHILPALKYLNNLSIVKEPNEILFITNEVGKNYLGRIKNGKINKLVINSKNKLSFILRILFNLSSLFICNRKITLIGFGGFITIPVLLISKIFNIFLFSSNKIFIHEQNYIYGLANKINYFIVNKAFISFPKKNIRSKEILVGNFFLDQKELREKIDDSFINILLIGGSAGSLDLNYRLLNELANLDRKFIEKIKFFIQLPKSHSETLKKKYIDLIDSSKFTFFSFKNNLNLKEYDLILSRSGSGSINEILYYTNNVYFIPHLVSRDQHQKFNLNYFLDHNMSKSEFHIPPKKRLISQFYFNTLINPYAIDKIICYTTR